MLENQENYLENAVSEAVAQAAREAADALTDAADEAEAELRTPQAEARSLRDPLAAGEKLMAVVMASLKRWLTEIDPYQP